MAEKIFLNTLVTEEMMKRIKDFQFDHRLDTRADAVRMLIEWALDHYKGGK
jgi:hypothetical protein